ncbi:hypothetical protein ACMDCR_10395 [Labrys okinawensis]|uniref:hypothetical protein n=1 Tax=Labrys okinawensis TaxID=346911 RepID=UPI0039BC4EE0
MISKTEQLSAEVQEAATARPRRHTSPHKALILAAALLSAAMVGGTIVAAAYEYGVISAVVLFVLALVLIIAFVDVFFANE